MEEGPPTYSAERWEPQQSVARYTSPLTYPSGAEPGHPGLPAEPTTSPRAFDPSQTVPAVSCGENAPRSQAGQSAPSLLIGHTLTARHRGWVPHRDFENPSVYHHTVSRTLELSLQSSFQSSLTVLVCYRSPRNVEPLENFISNIFKMRFKADLL